MNLYGSKSVDTKKVQCIRLAHEYEQTCQEMIKKKHGIGSSLRVSELAKAQGLVKDPGLQGPNAAEGRNTFTA